MQDPNMMQSNQQPAPAPQSQDDQGQGTPLDSCIATVDSFISDPKSITPQTLNQLKMDLEDLKTVMDGEESGPGEGAPSGPPQANGGLAEMIGGR